MGAVLGTAGCLACCFTSAACSLCSCCPSCKNSTSTRIVYALFLLFTTAVSMIMLSPAVAAKIENISWFCKFIDKETQCKLVVGYQAVYRVEFATCMFFLLLALLMIGVRSSRDPRAGIQNGFWAIKFLILIGAIVGAFFIPNDGNFFQAWMYVGLVGSFIFILHQLILLVDFAHSWNSNLVDNMEETGNKCWIVALITLTLLMYGGAIGGIVCMYIYFARSSSENCGLEKFIVSFELIMCIVMSIIAILPAVQDRQPKSGLFQAAAISLYTTYITWSALLYRESSCNSFSSHLGKLSFDSQTIVGLVITFVLVVFSCVRTTSSSNIGKIGLGDKETDHAVADTTNAEGKKQLVYDDEEEGLTYHYTFFHITMMLGTLYLMMTLTNWYKPLGANLSNLQVSNASFWVKITSSWLCIGLYLWTLIAPVIFPDRDFGN